MLQKHTLHKILLILTCLSYKTDQIFFYEFFHIYNNVDWIQYYKKKQKRLRKKARERYQNLS